MIRAILVDDELHALETLEWDIEQYCPELEVLASCQGSKEALRVIPRLQPELVFLDIEMPFMNAFELLERIGQINFDIIFTTAYDQYALRAFRVSAIDYLLKPINKNELKNAVAKVEKRHTHAVSKEQLEVLLNNIQSPLLQIVTFSTMEGLEFVQIDDIIFCRSDGNYTHVHIKGNRHLVVSKTLREVEEMLPPERFCRTHHSYLANLSHVVKYISREGILQMSNGEQVSVSRSRKAALLERIG